MLIDDSTLVEKLVSYLHHQHKHVKLFFLLNKLIGLYNLESKLTLIFLRTISFRNTY